MIAFPSGRPPGKSPARRAATLGLVPLGLLGGYIGGRILRAPKKRSLPPALSGVIEKLAIPFGQIAYYRDGPSDAAPLLLVHSVNAAANSYEVKPLYDHYSKTRAVYSIDLPGYGFSDRRDRIYTPRLMTEAVLALVEEIRHRHGAYPIDAIALSTSSEFLARAASEHPIFFRTLAMVSPTGFYSKRAGEGTAGSTYGMPAVRDVVSFPVWGRTLFDALVSRPSIRFFLAKTWGSPAIDEGLLDYDYASAHQPGAEYAPFSFISGFLFSADIMTIYKSLTLPVWMTHGIRGDFIDFKRKTEIEGRSNWTIQVFQTGAMSHFEKPDHFVSSYDDFLDRAA